MVMKGLLFVFYLFSIVWMQYLKWSNLASRDQNRLGRYTSWI